MSAMPLDWMMDFVERHVMPRSGEMRREFQREYLSVYAEWANDPVQDSSTHGQIRCQRLIDMCDNHLRNIASRYCCRILLQAVRCLPPTLVASFALQHDFQGVLDILRVTTDASYCYATPTAPLAMGRDGETSEISVSLADLERLRHDLWKDLASLCGSACLRVHAEKCYRAVGKGSVLEPAKPVAPDAWSVFEHYPAGGLLLLPGPKVLVDEIVQRSMDLYDRRRQAHGSVNVSGFLDRESAVVCPSPDGIHQPWWGAGFVGQTLVPPQRVVVNYSLLNKTVTSFAYFPTYEEARQHLERLRAFAHEFADRFGIVFDDFVAMCRALSVCVYEQAAFDQLEDNGPIPDGIALRSRLSPQDGRADRAPAFLFCLLARAGLRAPRRAFHRYLSAALERQELRERSEVADHFIAQFSHTGSMDPDFHPTLFIPVDRDLLMLDLFQMQEFFEKCLYTVTSSDGEVGGRRGETFEAESRRRISDGLRLAPVDVPMEPNFRIRHAGQVVGEIDFAFIWHDLLINLEMKSWQRRLSEFRGEQPAIERRTRRLIRSLTGQAEPSGRKLLAILNQARSRKLNGVLTFLCTAAVEYVPLACPEFLYGDVLRVLTADEIIEMLSQDSTYARLRPYAQTVS